MQNPTEWETLTGIPVPQCKMQGCCCRAASPSTPAKKLLEHAAQGDDFARNFLSQFVPYLTPGEAEAAVPGMTERMYRAAAKSEDFASLDDVVFYKCRYLGDDNRCQIYEDRPELCRSYPDTPFVVFAPGCAFEPWAKAVREKYLKIQAQVDELKALQARIRSGEPLDEETLDRLNALQLDESTL
jgi:Fe-S-cluster containining protein